MFQPPRHWAIQIKQYRVVGNPANNCLSQRVFADEFAPFFQSLEIKTFGFPNKSKP